MLWAYRTSPRSSTGVTPYALVYRHDAVLPVEINIKSLRVRCQAQLDPEHLYQSMCLELESIDEARSLALKSILFQKKKAVKNYNIKVKYIGCDDGYLVWKTILPIGIKRHKFGKWSANWEGPYQIHRVLSY